MIPKYLIDSEGELIEETHIDRILRPRASRYVSMDDLEPVLRAILDYQYYDDKYLKALEQIADLVNS